jgi:hypothetical protein
VAKQPVHVGMFYDGAWNDVTSRVRVADGITLLRGQQDEGAAARPSSIAFAVDNRDGWGLPTSPVSPFYAGGGRYVPVMCWLEPGLTSGDQADLHDSLNRTVASGWGTADSGQTYTQFTIGGGSAAVGSGVGSHTVPGASNAIGHLSMSTSLLDVDMLATGVRAPLATGGDLEVAGLIYRGQSLSTYGMVRIHLTTSNQVQIKVYRVDNGVQVGPTVTAPFTHAGASFPFNVRVTTSGQSIAVKVWLAAGAEPAVAQATVTDPSIIQSGFTGIRTGRASGNTNAGVTATYDALDVIWRDIRGFGEINTWTPQATGNFPVSSWTTGTPGVKGDAWTSVEAAGVLYRLNSGVQPDLDPAYQTYVPTTPNLAAYWPLNDAQATDNTMRNLVAGGAPINLTANQYSPRAAQLSDWAGPGLSGRAESGGASSLYTSGVVNLPTTTTSHTASVLVSGLTPQSGLTLYLTGSDAAGAVTFTSIYLNGATQTLTLSYNQFSPVASGTVYTGAAGYLFDGRMHQISIYQQDAGANVDFFLYADGVLVNATTVVTLDHRPIYSVDAFATGPAVIGHLAVWGTYTDPTTVLWTAARGYLNESPQARFTRLMTQAGIPFFVLGSNTDGMGPQRPAPLVQLLNECARTADGILYEPRSWLGLVLRGRDVQYTQAPAVVAPYAAGGIRHVLPVIDTRDLHNDVTVDNADGAKVRKFTGAGGLVDRVDTNYNATLNLDQLSRRADWELAKGAITGARYPSVTFDLDAAPAYATTAGLADIGRRFQITGLEPDPVGQIIRATREVIGSHRRTLTLQGTSDAVWLAGVYDGAASSYDSKTSVTTGAPNAVQTTFLVTTTDPADLWTLNPTSFPFDIVVAGERMTVTGITGAASPQTFAVTRSVNGVVKAHVTGAPVHLAVPPQARYAL